MYRCSTCGQQVAVFPNLIVRSCSCSGPIIAEARATLAGAGGLR